VLALHADGGGVAALPRRDVDAGEVLAGLFLVDARRFLLELEHRDAVPAADDGHVAVEPLDDQRPPVQGHRLLVLLGHLNGLGGLAAAANQEQAGHHPSCNRLHHGSQEGKRTGTRRWPDDPKLIDYPVGFPAALEPATYPGAPPPWNR